MSYRSDIEDAVAEWLDTHATYGGSRCTWVEETAEAWVKNQADVEEVLAKSKNVDPCDSKNESLRAYLAILRDLYAELNRL